MFLRCVLENISIHALREEGDCTFDAATGYNVLFLSTPSARRATCICIYHRHSHSAISIHALREEGDLFIQNDKNTVFISIHALREEGDLRER